MTTDNQDLILSNDDIEPQQSSLTDLVINNLHNIQTSDVRNINVSIDPKTGKEQLEVNLNNGNTLIQTNHSSGVTEKSMIQTPKFSSVQERNEAAKQLHNDGKTQDQIARIFNVSQTTIHNALK